LPPWLKPPVTPLLASSERSHHALDRFSAACDQTGIKISTEKTKVLCLFRNPINLLVNTATGQEDQVPWGGIDE